MRTHHDFVRWLHEKETGEQSDAETGEHTSDVDDYGDITERPPDADNTIPAAQTGTATAVPPANEATTSGERASTDADYGEKVTSEPPTTPIVETVAEDEDIPTSDTTTPNDDDNDDAEENSPLWVVLTDENRQPTNDKDGKPIKFKGLEPTELQGRTFLQPLEDGTIRRGRIVAQLQDHQDKFDNCDIMNRFRVAFGKDDVEDIIAYNDIMNYIQREHNEEDGTLWKFRRIVAHQGPLTHRHPDYKQCKYNVCIEWENGETTYEPLAKAIADDPITLALYAKEDNLLDG